MSTEMQRGEIGKQTYEAVKAHITNGRKATEAFKLVAQETGRSVGTVQTSYYRIARSLPGGGGVKLRPRGGKRAAAGAAKARAPRATGDASVQSLVKQLTQAAEALGAHVTRLENELAKSRHDSARLAEVQRLIGR
jgi:hypothetical protein